MLFTELPFFGFLAVVLCIHWCLRYNTHRKAWLLLASYAFYAAWDWRLLGLLLLVTLINWLAALRIAAATPRTRRLWLAFATVSGLGILGVFKYLDFFAGSAASLAGLLGLSLGWHQLNLVLPVGISFYVLHSLGYVVDVYRRELPPRRSLLDFSLFVAFFPQLAAGPVLRATSLLPQFDVPRRIADVPLRACLVLFLLGFAKKAAIADTLGALVDPVFAAPASHSGGAVAAAVYGYAVQIYCDFSGYTDMAIATAGLLGYRLPANFDRPYFAVGLVEFWRRWHISLSGWLRDYLYIPLGGNHGGGWRQSRNLMLTMVLGGLWHGAAAGFVIWGALHGGALVLQHAATRAAGRRGWRVPPVWVPALRLLGWAATFWYVCFCYIFFRATDLETALAISRAFVLSAPPLPGLLSLSSLAILAALHWYHPRLAAAGIWQAASTTRFALALGAAWAVVLSVRHLGERPFIYFQF